MMARKEFLLVAIATLITVLAWAVLNTFHARKVTDVPQEWIKAAEPINPNFNVGEDLK